MGKKKNTVETEYVLTSETIEGAGAMTWWTLSGDVAMDRLAMSWVTHNLNPLWLLSTPSTEVALRRAVQTLEGEAVEYGTLEVEFLRPTLEWAIAAKTIEHGFPLRTYILKVALNAAEQVERTFHRTTDPELADVLETRIKGRFEVELDRVASTDVSAWLTRIVESRLHGVCQREHGGIYYVPPASLPVWRNVKAALAEASAHSILNVPMLKSDEAVEVVLAGCIAEARKVIAKLTEALTENAEGNGPKGEAGLQSLAEKAADAQRRLAAYEKLLGVAMPEMQGQLATIKAGLFHAAGQAAQRKAARQ